MSYILFGLVAVTIISLIHSYFWMRFVKDTGLSGFWKTAITALLIVLAASMPVGMLVGGFSSFSVSRIVSWIPYIWMGAMMMFFFYFFAFFEILFFWDVLFTVWENSSGDNSMLVNIKL